ncbi:hypothetical protein ABGV42_25215 [Paenibacillus pabuli]|uniref:hypothetical protein n=1 Tax=Paenibacillus pabuli TaxID=1472 RepID=UPI003241C4C4
MIHEHLAPRCYLVCSCADAYCVILRPYLVRQRHTIQHVVRIDGLGGRATDILQPLKPEFGAYGYAPVSKAGMNAAWRLVPVMEMPQRTALPNCRPPTSWAGQISGFHAATTCSPLYYGLFNIVLY